MLKRIQHGEKKKLIFRNLFLKYIKSISIIFLRFILEINTKSTNYYFLFVIALATSVG